MSSNDTYPQHVVTAVIVAHDGVAWLPRVIDALLEQARPVQRVVAVDTGSRDRSGGLLAAKLGQGVVFGMDRSTGYGAAVARALQHKAATVSVPGPSAHDQAGRARGERVEWIWLLHDDCEPAPDALEQLLRGAAETPNAAVLGPKVMDWSDRDVILEAGLTIDTVGRRITGIEPREVDQGQHDGDRDTLAVGSAGMLVRRDVWDQVRGFDTSMGLFREDVDFCWRVHAAGYRVRVITDAVVYHVQAMTRRRRAVSVGRRQQLLDRRNALLTLTGNLPLRPMLASLAGNIMVSCLRALFFLLAKRVTAALDETAAVASVLLHPLRLLRARRLRARGRKAAYGRLRGDLPAGRSFRRVAEFVAAMSGTAQQDTAGSHHSTEDPDADDFLLTDSGFAQRILTNPGVLLFLGLAIVTGVAERSLLAAGTLGGGALLPADGATGLWHQYLQGFHPTGIGSPSVAPPYLAILAILATVLVGKAWLAVSVVLLGSVPIAGMTAFLAVRRVTASVPVRVWAAATYALIPVATGAISAGRLGTAVTFALVPLIGLLAGRMFSQPPRVARRAAWATGLAIAVGAAFVPLLWLLALAAAAVAALTLRKARPAVLRNLAIATLVPPVLLVPWTFQLATHPTALLLEAGAQQAGLASRDLPVRSVMLLSPGGPGLPPYWVTAGLVLAALVALVLSRRRVLVMSGWTMAVLGLLVAAGVSRLSVRSAAGGAPVNVWPGVALALTAAGLLLAAAAGGDSLGRALASRRTGLRRFLSLRGGAIALLAIAACSAPVAAAGFWVRSGVSGPIGPATTQVVPPLVALSASSGAQERTLILSSSGSHVSYQLLRGSGAMLGDAELAPVPTAERALRTAVAALAAPAGGQAVDQGQLLSSFDIGFVLMRAPINQGLANTLNGVAGLRTVSMTASFDLWRLAIPSSRVSVVESNGTVVTVPSGQVGVSGAPAPAAGGTLLLAEPAGGWHATLNGHPLTAVPSPSGSWAQAFRLPAGGGTLDIGRSALGHDLAIALELLAALVVAALALPGVRAAGEAHAVSDDAVAGAVSDEDVAGAEPAEDEADSEPPGRVPAGAGVAGAGVAGAGVAGAGVAGATALAGQPAGRAGASRVPVDSESAGRVPASRALAGFGPDGRTPAGYGHGRRAPADSEPAGRTAASPAAAGLAAGLAGEELAAGTPAGGRGARGGVKGRVKGRGLSRRARRGGQDDAAQPGTEQLRPARSSGRGRRHDADGQPADGQPAAEYGAAEDGAAGRPRGRFARDAARPDARADPTAAGRSGMAGGHRPGRDRADQGRADRDRADRDRADQGWTDSESQAGSPGSESAGRVQAGWAAAERGADNGGADRAGRDAGVRSPTGAWPYPEESGPAAAPAPAGSPARERPYPPEPARQPADVTSGQYASGEYGSGEYGSGEYGSGEYGSGEYGSGEYGNRPPAPRPAAPHSVPPSSAPPGGWSAASPPAAPYDAAASWQEAAQPWRRPGPEAAGQEPARPDPGRPEPRGLDSGWPGQVRPDPGWQEAARWQEAQRQSGRPAEPSAASGGWPQQPESRPDRGGPALAPGQPPPSSWPAHGQPSSWPQQEQAAWPSPGQSSWSSAGQSPGPGDDWQPNGQADGAPDWHDDARPAGGRAPRGQQDWPAERQSPGWPSSGDALEPLPSAEVHHGAPAVGPDERSRRRWPAPQDDDPGEGGSW